MWKKTITIILLGVFTSACAQHTAVFVSDPPGARVFVNGESIGQTPCTYKYKCSAGGDFQLVIAKEGFETIHHDVKADEWDQQSRNRWLAAGVIWSPLWLGTLFTRKLKDDYEFVLQRSGPEITAQAETIPPKF